MTVKLDTDDAETRAVLVLLSLPELEFLSEINSLALFAPGALASQGFTASLSMRSAQDFINARRARHVRGTHTHVVYFKPEAHIHIFGKGWVSPTIPISPFTVADFGRFRVVLRPRGPRRQGASYILPSHNSPAAQPG